MGRRKIDIAPIRDDRNRSVTLIKRKAGLFKKAHELAVLCQVDIALVVISKDGRVFQYSTTEDIKQIFDKQQQCQVMETKYPGDYGYGPLVSRPAPKKLRKYDIQEESSDDSDSDLPPGLRTQVRHVHSSSHLSDSSSSRPRLKVQIPQTSQEAKKGQNPTPGPLTALAAESGIDSAALPVMPSPMNPLNPNSHQMQRMAPHGGQTDQLSVNAQQPQQQYQLSPQQYGMPYNYQQPYMVQQQQQQQQQQMYDQQGRYKSGQQDRGQQVHQMGVSPNGMYPQYSSMGYSNFLNPMSANTMGAYYNPSTGYNVQHGGPPNAQQPSSSSSTSSNGNGNPANNSGNAGGNRWNAYGNSPMSYVVPSNPDSAKPDSAGPGAGSIQARYGLNEMMMSPSNLLSMEWNSWDRMGQQQQQQQQQHQGVSMDGTGVTPNRGPTSGMGQPGVRAVPGGQNQYNMATAGSNPLISVQPPSESGIKSPNSDATQLGNSSHRGSVSEQTAQNTNSLPDGDVRKRPNNSQDPRSSKWPKA